MSEALSMYSEIRSAAKAVLFDTENRVVFAAGQSGMLNLPGGGFNAGESPEETVYREMAEEGVPDYVLAGQLTPLPGGRVCGPGRNEWLEWDVFYGRITVPAASLSRSSEITRIEGWDPQEALALSYPMVSKLAIKSIARTLRYI